MGKAWLRRHAPLPVSLAAVVIVAVPAVVAAVTFAVGVEAHLDDVPDTSIRSCEVLSGGRRRVRSCTCAR